MNLETTYLKLRLESPLVAAASPLTGTMDGLLALADAGVSAVVLPSLFEEQVVHDEFEVHRMLTFGAESHAEASDYFPELETYNTGPDRYLEHLSRAKERLSIPVIASLNGSTKGGWLQFAKSFEEAGADAVELNIHYVPSDLEMSGREVEQRYLEVTQAVREVLDIPFAVKIGPYFSATGHMARMLVATGADGLVLFNRYLEPDMDTELLEIVPKLHFSRPEDLRLPLRWIGLLSGQTPASLAATTGAHDYLDVVKLVLAGADAVMMASTLLKKGPEHLREIRAGLTQWLEEHEYESLDQAKGTMSRVNCPHPDRFERANYMKTLVSYTGGFH